MLRIRYLKILWFFARSLIHLGFWDIFLVHFGFRKFVERTRGKRLQNIAKQFRHLAVHMGGVMIKVGQFLSARVDIFPSEITDELAGLQDEVPAEPFEAIRKIAEADLGMPLEQKFTFFDPAPVAAASLGQAHRARILQNRSTYLEDQMDFKEDGSELGEAGKEYLLDVVVKVQRPNIEVIIATDLAALKTVGNWLKRYKPIRKRADIPALLGEFERILYQEIDYLHEGRNIEVFTRNFAGISGVRAPKVIWSHTSKRVLTLEDVGGIKISDYDAITAAGICRRDVAARLLDIYFKQIFEDGFFHADPHPGNLFVKPLESSPEGEPTWELVLVDFGMVGTISPEMMRGLQEMLIAIATRDSPRLIQAYLTLNFLLPGADLELLEKANNRVFERFWGKRMGELREISQEEIVDLIKEFRALLFSLPFQIPHDLIFLARAVGLLSGMCTGLDPDFNVWDHMAPYAQKLIFREAAFGQLPGLPAGIANAWKEVFYLVQKIVSFPGRVEAVFRQFEKGEFSVRDRYLEERVNQLRSAVVQTGRGLLFAVFLLSAVQLYLAGEIALTIVFAIVALIFFVWFLFAPLRE